MTPTPTTEERAAALKWLDAWERCGWPADMRPARTIKAMLAEPRVPDVCDHAAIDGLVNRLAADGYPNIPRDGVVAVIRAMHEPPKPATKEIEVERWVVMSGKWVCSFHETETQARSACFGCESLTVARLTGKATVPASSKGSE